MMKEKNDFEVIMIVKDIKTGVKYDPIKEFERLLEKHKDVMVRLKNVK